MTRVDLSFVVRLQRNDIDEAPVRGLYGPIFHRWLPDGEGDALLIDTSDPDAELKIWFERTGYVRGAFVEFDYHRREVEPDRVSRQALLDAGPLRGSLVIRDIDPVIVDVLRNNGTNDQNYIQFGKRVVELLYTPLASVIDILRVRYGQYWIAPLASWDSRTHSIGAYCRHVLPLWFRLDEAKDWNKFVPDDPVVRGHIDVEAPGPKLFAQYITNADWQEVQSLANAGYKPSRAGATLITSLELMHHGSLGQAFIVAVTALELAISELVTKRISESKISVAGVQAFWKLPLPTQLLVTTSLLGSLSGDEIEGAAKAVKIRNEIVHDGRAVTEKDEPELRALIACVAKIIPGPGFRLPSAYFGNTLFPPE